MCSSAIERAVTWYQPSWPGAWLQRACAGVTQLSQLANQFHDVKLIRNSERATHDEAALRLAGRLEAVALVEPDRGRVLLHRERERGVPLLARSLEQRIEQLLAETMLAPRR